MKKILLHGDAHHRLAIGLAGGALAALIPGAESTPAFGALKIWIAFAGVMMVMITRLVLMADPAEVRASAKLQDAGRTVILVIVLVAAFGSLFFVATLFREGKSGTVGGWGGVAVAAVLLAWGLIHALYALHYAHVYYGDQGGPSGKHGGLTFPGGKTPDYLDFVYFSFVIGMTAQVSDVVVTSRRLRRLVLAHSVIAFFFNTIVLALTITLIATMVGGG
jgi:uncharacterized membrane protein